MRILLNRPATRNALDADTIRELIEAVRQAKQESRTRCVILSGAGPVFCAGGRVQWLREGGTGDSNANLRDIQNLVLMLRELNELPVPVIAGIQGAAIGGGAGLASVADAVICSAEAVFSLSEARLGLVPSCIAPFLIDKIGPSWVRRYMLTGERFDAVTARAIGLAHEVVPSPKDLESAVDEIAASILQCAPQAVRRAKQMLHEFNWPETRALVGDWERHAAEIFAQSRAGKEGQEGLTSFLEKRPPKWRP